MAELPMLRDNRAKNAALHDQTRELFLALDKRLCGVETAQTSYRPALSADTLLSKLVTGGVRGTNLGS